MSQDQPQQQPRKRGRPPKIGPPVSKRPEPTGRYVECFCNRHLHEPRLIPVLEGPKRFFCRCPCTGNGFLPRIWTRETGYTLEQAKKLVETQGFIICGY